MAILTDEAKQAIEKHVNEHIKEFKQTIFILNSLKWITGILISVFCIGTYKGIDTLLDNKVNTKLGYYYEFMNAEAFIAKAEYPIAYKLILNAKQKLDKEGMISQTLQNIYFIDLITILANMNIYNTNNRSFEGSQTWKELNADKAFLNASNDITWGYYPSIRINLCKIKFEDSTNTIKALNTIQEISKSLNIRAASEEEYLDRFWYIFITSVVKKDNATAKSYRDSLVLHQPSYFEKYIVNKRINLNSTIIDYWNNINNKVNSEDREKFISRLEKGIYPN